MSDDFDGAAGMTARENMDRDAVSPPERDVDAVTDTLTAASEGDRVKIGMAVVVDGEDTGGTSVMNVHGVEADPPGFDRRINLLHHDGITNRLYITGVGNDGLDPWEIVSAPYDPMTKTLDSRDMAFHGWVVGAKIVTDAAKDAVESENE